MTPEPPVTADHTPERLSAEERGIRGLTLAAMHFYGYTDEDIAEAEAVHPGRVCSEEECYDEDGKSVHPRAYDELGGTASTVVEVIWPWVAAHLADMEARLAAERAAGVNEGIRLAAQLVKDHALGPVVTPDNVVEFLIRRADRATLHPDPSGAT